MVILACSRQPAGTTHSRWSSRTAIAGALLFGVSDTVLALDRFVPWAKHSAAPGLVMSTYFMGQGLISLSAKGAGGKPKTAGGSIRSAAKGKSAE
jgi:uncharacterized membrane protein YhhN